MDVRMPDGTIIRGVPDGTPKDQVYAKWQASKPRRVPDGAGLGEAAISLGSGMIAAPVAGIAGLGSIATKAAGMTEMPAGDVVRNVQSALTYQPRSALGEKLAGYAAWPFEKIAQGADYVGGRTTDVTGSPALGAGINAVLQFAPALVLKGKRGTVKSKGAAEPAAAAEAYVRTRVPGVDWAALPDSFKTSLTDIARDAKALDSLDPIALERQILLQSLPEPVPATAGQLTRDPVQLRREGMVAATEAGKPIRDVQVAQNEALLRNLEILKRRQGGAATGAEQTGKAVQGALDAQLRAKKNEVSLKYRQADAAGETAQRVDATPILDLLKSKPDVTEYGWAQSWMNKMDVREAKPAKPVAPQSSTDMYMLKEPPAQPAPKVPEISIRELEKLRQDAGIRTRNGGTEAYYAGQLIDMIDNLTEGKGGALYAEARKARREQADLFQNRRGVGQLVEDKTRTDPRVALEDTWNKTVISGSIQDLRNVKQQLLSGSKTNASGKQAWRELRAQTAQFIVDQSTKTVSNYEGAGLTGTRNVSAAGLQQAINRIGRDKVQEIFGPDSAKILAQIEKATSLTKTDPPQSFKGSPTVPNALAFFERFLGKVPLVGDTAVGTVRAVSQLREAGANVKVANAATQDPVSAAAAGAKNSLYRARKKNTLASTAPTAATASERQ
jgi:hypothetical protein